MYYKLIMCAPTTLTVAVVVDVVEVEVLATHVSFALPEPSEANALNAMNCQYTLSLLFRKEVFALGTASPDELKK